MTQLTSIAATHDHWSTEPAIRHLGPSIKLWWRHFSRHHPLLIEAAEWTGAGVIAIALLAAELIANA